MLQNVKVFKFLEILFFSGLAYKANTHFIPVFCFCILQSQIGQNYAMIIVWMCWYGCLSVVCMCVIKKNNVFVCL